MATSDRARQLLQLGEERRKKQQTTTQQTGTGASDTANSTAVSTDRQKQLLQLGEERRQSQKSSNAGVEQQAWINKYNNLQKTLSGEYSTDEVMPTVQSLVSEYRQMRQKYGDADFGDDMYSGYIGLLSMQERNNDLKRWQKEQEEEAAARAQQASGIFSDEAEALRQEREQLQADLDAYLESGEADEALMANSWLHAFSTSPFTQPAEDSKRTELEERIAAIDAQLNLYDRIDGFQDTRITPLKTQEGFATARGDFQNNNAARVAGIQNQIDNYSYDWTDTNQRKQAETDIANLENEKTDELGEYLAWWEGLNDYTKEAYLNNELMLDRRSDSANPWDYMLDSDSELDRNLRNQDIKAAQHHWERMTEDEINAYYYLANTEGMAAAKEFLDDLQVTLDWRYTKAQEAADTQRLEENTSTLGAAAMGVLSVVPNVVAGPLAFASDVVNEVQGKEFNPYNKWHSAQSTIGLVRSVGSNKIQEEIAGDGSSKFWNGVGEVAANAYQAGLSTLDSLAGMATMGNAYTVSMGMGAASSRMRELYESGATDQEIYVGAIGSGILEALFEKVSLEYFTNDFIKANPEKWIKKAMLQAGVEGSEEFFTEISNLMLDAINRGLNSDHNQRVRELMNDPENPLSREEAQKQAAKEDTMDVFWAFLGGVMSGGMSSIGGAVLDSSRQNQIGQDVFYRNVQGDVIAEAQELRPDDSLAATLKSKQEEGTLGKKRSDATKLGRLIEQNVADMTGKDMRAVTSAVEARLKQENLRNPEATAEAIVKSLAGEDLSMADRYYLAINEKFADKIKSEIYSVADGRTDNNKWVREIGTYTFAPGTFGQNKTQVQQAGEAAMKKAVQENFGSYSDLVLDMYRSSQNRMDFVAEVKQMYQAGMDGVSLENAPKTKTLEDWQRQAAWDMGQGKSEYDYANQGFATIKGETTPVNIVGVAATGKGQLTLRTDEGGTVDAKDVTFGSYSESKLYSVISLMGVDTSTANEILSMSKESELDLNEFSRAMQDAFYAGRNGIPFSDIQGDRMAMKLTREQRKFAWQEGRAAARERSVQKNKRIQQGKHAKLRGELNVESSAKGIKNLNKQQKAGMDAARVLSAMGLNITVYASTEEQRAKGIENGNIRLSDGSIRIDLNAGDSGEGVMAWALSHEFTHFVEELNPQKFQTFQELLFEELGQSGQDVAELIDEKVALLQMQRAYRDLSEDRLMEIATSEVVAEMMEPMLTDTDAIARISDKLRQQDKSLWTKIKDWITSLVEKLKNAYKDLTPGSTIAQQTRSVVTQSEAILEAWTDVASEAVVNYTLQDGQKNNTPGGVQYSARSLSEQIDDIANQTFDTKNHVYYGTTPRALSNILSIPIMPMLGTQTHAYAMALSKKQAQNEGRRTSGLHFHELGWGAVKAIPDMLNHPLAVIKSNTDTTDSRFVVVTNATDKEGRPIIAAIAPKGNGKYYNLDMMATVMLSEYGRNGFQNYLAKAKTENRILWIDKKNHHEQASPGVQFSNALLHGDYTSNLAQFKQIVKNEFAETVFRNTFDENGDRLFSSRNVQQTKNLVALHNITEDKFLKTLELGGFPMPSIAITKADIPHTNFGDITVVFGRETIDPKANRKNTVYSADAWTPTVPQVEYEADSKATSRVYKQLSGLKNQVDEYFRRDLSYATYNIENALNQYGGEEGVVQAALDNYGVKAAYLEEQGQHITPETKQETVGTPVSEEMQNRYVKIMDILGVDTPEQIGKLILKEVREQHGAELEAVYPGITKSTLRLGGVLNRLKAWLQGDNGVETRTVTDVATTKNAVDSAIDQTEFEAWVRNLYQGVEKSSGVYNGKPRFTEAGNSRTFKQTHLPATLEGIVKAMAAQNGGNTKNVSGFNGVKTLRAGTAERFSSIADMHKMEGRLQNLTQVQQDEIHDSLSTRLYDVIKAIDEEAGSKLGGSNSLVRYDTIGEVLMEIAESGSYNVADIQRTFQQYGKTISDETAIAAKELLFDVSQMPVNIFEAKPERGVGFEEIKTVLVPDTASQKLLQKLDGRGIPYQTYQAGNEEQRHQMVQDMEDIRFSQRSTQLEQENEKLRRDKAYLEEVLRIQRKGNKELVPQRSSVNKVAEQLKKDTGARGSTAELSKLLEEFYRSVGKGEDDATKMQKAEAAADWIQEHQPVKRDPYAQEILDWMKKRHVALTQTQVDEVKYQYGSIREFQSAIKGSIIIDSKSNTDLGQLWQEAAGAYPDQFDINMSEGDMPGAFADLVETLKNSESTESAEQKYMAEEIYQELLSKVYVSMANVERVGSISEDMRKEIAKLKEQKRISDREIAELRRGTEKLQADKEKLTEQLKIQKEGNKDFVPTRASVNQQAKSLMEQTGAVGNQKEFADLLEAYYRQRGKRTQSEATGENLVKAATWLENHQGTGNLMELIWRSADEVKSVSSVADQLKEQKAKTTAAEKENRTTLKAMQDIRKAALDSYRKQQTASDQRMRQLYEQQYRLVMDDYQKQLEQAEGEGKTSEKVEGWRKTEERGKLQRTLNSLNKMLLNPTRTAFVPDSLQPAVIKAMEVFNDYRLAEAPDMEKIRSLRSELDKLNLEGTKKNLTRIRQINRQLDKLQGDYGSVQDTLTELKRMYAELIDSNEGKVAQIYDEGVESLIADAMDAIKGTEYGDLSVSQLEALNDAYAAILYRIRTANKTFAYGQQEAISDLAKRAGGEIKSLKDREKLSGEHVGPLEKFGWNNLKPEYAFERLGSQTMTTLYHNLRKGEDVFYNDIVDARAYAVGAMNKHGYKNWQDKVMEFESVDGKKFSLNLEERMSIYAYSRRRQAIEHLMRGGIVLNENTKRTVKGLFGIKTEKVFHDYNNYRLSLDTIQAIGDSLTQQQKKFAEEMQQYLSTTCAEKNNEISRALYGVSKAKEKYYWPLKVSDLFSERVRNQQQNPGNRKKNAGHMKATTPHANNPVEVAGFMETWGNHVNNTAMYHAFTLPMEDFLRVYNFNSTEGVKDESMVQLITQKHGKAATEYIDQFMKDLNQGVRADPRESIAGALTSKFKKGAVSASLSVAIQQPSAVGRAFAVIDPKYFSLADLRYYATSTVGQKAAEERWETVKKYAPVAGIKELGRFDVNMGRSTVDFITGAGESGFMAKVDEISGYLPEKMDQATWMMIFNAAERQCKAQGYKGEALMKAAGNLFTEAITKTQVYDSVFSRSGNMRSKSLYMNMATSFMAESTTTANMFVSAMADAKNKDWKSAGRKVSSIATATVLNAILASFVYAARDDDEDSPYREKLLKSFTSEMIDSVNPLGYVPIVKDVWSLLQGYDIDRADMTLWSEAATTMNRLKSAYENLASLDEDDADYEDKLAKAQSKLAEAWGNAAGAICNMFGLPVKNLLREIRAIVNTWETVGEDRAADWETAKYGMWEAFQENLPEIIRAEDGKAEQLYKAMMSGSDVWIERMKDSYTDEKAFNNAVRGALRDYDERIRKAAKVLDDANSSQYTAYVQEILGEGHFTEEQVNGAILAEARAIKGEFEGYSTQIIEKFVDLYEDNLMTAEQFTDFWDYRSAEDETGKKLHDKTELIVYIGKMKVNTKAKDTLYLEVLKYNEKDLESTPWHSSGYTSWEAKVDHPELAEAGDSATAAWIELETKEVSASMFAKLWEFRHEKDDEDKQIHDWEDVRDYIDALPISDYSKDELFLAAGYGEKKLKKIRWS